MRREKKYWLMRRRFMATGMAVFMLSATGGDLRAEEADLEVQVSEDAAKEASETAGGTETAAEEAEKQQADTEQTPSETAPEDSRDTQAVQENTKDAEANTESIAETGSITEKDAKTDTESVTEKDAKTETESVTEKDAKTETESVTEKDAKTETESVTEKDAKTETESVTERDAKTETESVTEKDAKTDTESAAQEEERNGTESADETEAEARLEASVKQEVFAEADQTLSVKYTVTVSNQAGAGKAEEITVKAVLGRTLSYYSREGQSAGLNYVEDLNQLPDGLDLEELSGLSGETLKNYGSAVIWADEALPEGGRKEYVFYAHVDHAAAGPESLPVLFFADGERLGETRIQWINEALLAQKEEIETGEEILAELPAEYPIQASWEGETLSVGDTVTLRALTGEENLPVVWEACKEEGTWSAVAEGETYVYELTLDNFETSFRAISGTREEELEEVCLE